MIESQSVKEHFYRIKHLKKEIIEAQEAGEELTEEQKKVLKIPLDQTIVRVELVRNNKKIMCLYCGSPHMETAVSPYECKKCYISRMTDFYGSKPEAEKQYKEMKRMMEKDPHEKPKNGLIKTESAPADEKAFEKIQKDYIDDGTFQEVPDELPF